MSSNPSKAKSERIRHRIKAIELQPMRSKYPISMKLWVDDKVVCELPEIKKGQDLIWSRPIVCRDASPQSKVNLEIWEIHTVMHRSFKSRTYAISEVQDQVETTIGFSGTEWAAKLTMLTPETVQQSHVDTLQRLKETELAPAVMERLGTAQKVFAAALDFGNAVADVHPAAKLVLSVCTVAWEKLKEEEQLKEDTQELLDGLVDITRLAESVRKTTKMQQLKDTIEDILILLEDVFIYMLEHESNGSGGAMQMLRRVFDSSDRDTVQEMLGQYRKLRTNFDSAVGADTHDMVYQQELQQFLDKLQPVSAAGYNLGRACQDGTREHIIAKIINWTEQRSNSAQKSGSILWINGQAGIGKSSIASSVCGKLKEANALGASFFCKRDGGSDLHDPFRLINTIAYSLANRCPEYAQAVVVAMKGDRELCMTNTLNDRYEGLIERPLESLKKLAMPRPLIVLIDALDEFGSVESRDSIMGPLSNMSQLVPWLKVIITSRPDGDIKQFFGRLGDLLVSPLNVQDFDASGDIRAYLQKELGRFAARPGWKWPEGIIDRLTEKAGGLFIWASTVKRYIEGLLAFKTAMDRLNDILGGRSEHRGLDQLYKQVLENGLKDTGDDNKEVFCQCIGVIISASTRQPLSLADLSSLMKERIEEGMLEAVVDRLGAVIHVDQQMGNALRFYHQSFVDYLVGQSQFSNFHIDLAKRNEELAASCLKIMEQGLKFNICGLETSHLFNTQVSNLDERVKMNISNWLSYSCVYWISHLMDTPRGTLSKELDALLNKPRILYWLEALSLLSRVDVGLTGLLGLLDWIPSEHAEARGSVNDMYRFTSAFYDAISASAPHLYVSALAFAPESAGVVRRFGSFFPNTVAVIGGRDKTWPDWLRTLAHPRSVLSLAVSSDGRRLVTSCDDCIMRLWDIRTGTRVGKPLVCQSSSAQSVAFSTKGDRIISGFFDGTLQMWDAETCEAVGRPVVGHPNYVWSVAFSPNDDLFASGGFDNTVRVWDAQTGAAIGEPLVGHSSTVTSVTFSPNGDFIISASHDGTIRMWDAKTRSSIGEPLVTHSYRLETLALSPKGDLMVSGSHDGTVRIWDTKTHDAIGEPLVGHSRAVASVAFSSNNNFVVSGSHDKTVRVWDAKAGAAISEPLVGHTDWVKSVAFVPNSDLVVSASNDNTVRVWDLKTRAPSGDSIPQHSHAVTSVAFSSDGDFIVSGSSDSTVRIWDSKTYAPIGEPLVGHSEEVTCVALSPNADLIVSGSFDHTLRMWDAKAHTSIGEPLVGHTLGVTSVAFSPNAEFIVSSSWDHTVRLWDAKTRTAIGEPFVGHSETVSSVAFSPGGDFIVSGSNDMTVRIWDVKTRSAIGEPLAGHSHYVMCIAVSPNGNLVASGSLDGTLRIWDVKSFASIKELVSHSGWVESVTFSPLGDMIVCACSDKTLQIWDTKTHSAIDPPLVGHSHDATSVAFSPSGDLIVSGSLDNMLRVWDVKLLAPTFPTTLPPLLSLSIHGLPALSKHDGWASLDNSSLLLWLPVRYRVPYDHRSLHCISADPNQSPILLDFSKFAHGTSWMSVASESVLRDRI